MSKSNLSPPIIEDSSTRRAINELYRQVNRILTSISPDAQKYDKEALEGSVRAIYEGKGNYRIEGKTDAGWASITAQAQGKGNLYNKAPKIDSSGRLNMSEAIYGKNALKLQSGSSLDIDANLVGDATKGIKFKNNGTQLAKINTHHDATYFYMYEKGGASAEDYFSIAVGENGATILGTLDTDGDSADLTLDVDGDIMLNADSGNVTIRDDTATHFLFDCTNTRMRIFDDTTESDFFNIGVGANGATTISTVDNDGTSGHLILAPDGEVKVSGASLQIDSGEVLHFSDDGGTFIQEHSADYVRFVVGSELIMSMDENGDDGNQVHFYDSSVGFTQLQPTYDATDTYVDFRFSNKQHLTFGAGSITRINLRFPAMSGNFVLLLKQDGTGSRTITNWKVQEFDETGADGSAAVKWAGGSNPTLTTDANHVDILSFYWDANNEICYGVATLDFQF